MDVYHQCQLSDNYGFGAKVGSLSLSLLLSFLCEIPKHWFKRPVSTLDMLISCTKRKDASFDGNSIIIFTIFLLLSFSEDKELEFL